MKNRLKLVGGNSLSVMMLAWMMVSNAQAVITVTPDEMAQKDQWVQQNLLTATNPPFSFTYSGQASSVLLPSWARTQTDTVLDSNRVQRVITWTNNYLQVKCVAVDYNDYPIVEWTVYLKAIGPRSTPIIENIQGLDTTISRTNGPEFVLNGNKGDSASPDSYEPYQITLNPSTVKNFSPPSYSGKSCDGPNGWPYYNLQVPGGGIILAIGWPGQWASSFVRDGGNDLRIEAGQQLTHLILNPGEEIRTPLIAMMFWKGTNVVRSQNIWRHFYMAHVIPRVNGKPPTPFVAITGDSINDVDNYLDAGIKPDVLWRDADTKPYTWYPVAPYANTTANWIYTGNWRVDTNSYPNGFGPVSAAVHALGMKFLLWFEPERVGNPHSWLATNNLSWLLPATSSTVGAILNEGDPNAFHWLTNHIENMIISNGIDWYREDMNGSGPLPAWRNNDATNRQGITENFYVQGHLAYWDALLAMNPGLRIDCCGSGGRRNDLEAMRRAVPLWRSDYLGGGNMTALARANQCFTYELSFWLPFQGSSRSWNPYSFRSSSVTELGMGGVDASTAAEQRQAYTEFKKLAPITLNGDYYPLTPYSLSRNVWMAWQFDRPESGEGYVQIFRRTNSPVASMTFKLQGLNPAQTYAVSNFDTGNLGYFTGNQLMSVGLTVQLHPQQSAILYYSTPGIKLSATGNPVVGGKPLTVKFTATATAASGAPVTYTWDFGDGEKSTDQNPTHIYRKGGRYTAQVSASDEQGDLKTAPVAITVIGTSGYLMKTTFSGYTQNETLTNFPALMIFGPNLRSNGFSYDQMASPKGQDLVFMNSDATQPLNYEIEKWNTNGSSFVWVQIPLLTSNTSILTYWGDADLASQSVAGAANGSVWSKGYVNVWHFGEASGKLYDSTSNRVYGSAFATHGRVNQGAVGKIGNGCFFGGGYISANAMLLPGGSRPRTVSAWFKKSSSTITSSGEEILGYGNNSTAGDRFGLWVGGSGESANALGVEIQQGARTFAWAWNSDWHYLATTLSPGQDDLNAVKIYYDGVENTSATGSGTLDTLNDELCFAAIPGYHTDDLDYNFLGTLDEVRISNTARSPNWLWAEYMTVASNEVFNSYGTVIPYTNFDFTARLTITADHNNVHIFWPASAAPTAVLQESTDLIIWTNSPAVIATSGTRSMAIVVPKSAMKFYRLVL